ncbi:response regulator [Mucilaginibacter limnophilus]|uniref:histidine kinase n=1 Tax=Mucilaginibacter limnophilus TaxID=1932778 RepID=A0A437MI34_9SPHI|nr:hybrid sensor histidine kinase/response regulator transcription factor [Mucilaginibacter limnophilus]RVT97301.1 response regulator [Mucilaginibacter limnophilus]
MKHFYLILLLACLIASANAQSYYFRHYQVENGLSNSTINDCIQDKRGFLWIATRDGLNRFDGYSFKVFRHDPNKSNSIGNDLIRSLHEDQQGRLWVGTDLGLYIYNYDQESFTRIAPDLIADAFALQSDRNGMLWFLSSGKLFQYSATDTVLRQIAANTRLYADALNIAKDGTVWIASSNGTISKLNKAHNAFKSYNVFSHSPKAASYYIQSLLSTDDGKLFVGSINQGIKLFDCKTEDYKDLLTVGKDKTDLYVRDFLKYSDNEYWVGTEAGIYIFDTRSEKFTCLQKDFNDAYSLSDNAVYSLYKDREGGVWAGTFFGGLNYYPSQYSAFNKFYPGKKGSSLVGDIVRNITKDKYGNLWIGTEDNGLSKLDKNGKWTNYSPNADNYVSSTNIHGLMPVNNELLVGTFCQGTNLLNISTGKLIRNFKDDKSKNSIISNFADCMYKTQSGEILIGTTRGLFSYDATKRTFKSYEFVPNHDFVSIIKGDHKGRIWIGTVHDGIYFIDKKIGKSGKFNFGYPQMQRLELTAVNDIFEDSNNTLWITTDGDGLWKYDAHSNSFKIYNTTHGLPSNYVFCILEDDKKNLWISTSKGLAAFNIVTEKVKVYTKDNGLLSNQFNYKASFKDTDGTMYFGCLKGMISFNPAQFRDNSYVAPVYITGLQVYNKEISIGNKDFPASSSIISAKQITLQYDKATFSLDFAALGYTAPEATRYMYKMDGLDRGWTHLKTNRKVYFTNLQPGTYTFIVKALNSANIPSEARLEVVITPPFWASVWAYLVYCLAFIITAFYIIRRYHLKSSERHNHMIEILNNEKEKEIYHAKIEFFTNVAHEIRTPLTLIKGPMENVLRNVDNMPTIKSNLLIMERNTNRLLNLTNQLLDFRKSEVKGLSLNFVRVNINKLLENNFEVFKSLADQKGINYYLKIPNEHLFAYVDIEAFTKISSNLFLNAIKYSNKQVVIELIATQSSSTTFNIVVKNDGHVIPAEMHEKIFEPFYRMKNNEKETGTGIGLSLSRSLAELHKGTLILTTSKDKNTFILNLPIHQDTEIDLYHNDGVMLHRATNNIDPHKPFILVIDDNTEILEFIAGELEEKYTVLKAQSGADALRIVAIENIQLIISDVMMPQMDGYELCKTIKTNLDYSHIPVILLTAKNSLQNKIEGLYNGADAYIDKPFSPQFLLAQVASLLINRNKIHDHFANSPMAGILTMANSKADEKFLNKLNEVINNNISNQLLDVEQIASILNMSKPTLFRKVKAISNLSINELINISRLKMAARLLVENDYKIYEVADMVGYSSQSNFGRNFIKQFGITPSEYVSKNREQSVKA